jgi:GTP cyclohydrolase I
VDSRGVELDRVGVTGLYYPLIIREKAGGQQTVTTRIDLFVGLHARQRGAHLSSLVEALDSYRDRLFSMDDLLTLVQNIRAHQDERGLAFDRAEIRICFKYFVSKAAPSSGLTALVAYDCGFDVALHGTGYKSIIVGVPVTTVCPCSLEISEIGAHNQRAEVSVQLWQALDDKRFIWFEDVIDLVEGCASSAVHSLLKRVDEKAVTEQMFRAPRFVEDIVRDVVLRLRQEIGSIRYTVRCESFESIHAHNAYAEASGIC